MSAQQLKRPVKRGISVLPRGVAGKGQKQPTLRNGVNLGNRIVVREVLRAWHLRKWWRHH